MMQFYMGDLLLLGITKGNVDKLVEGKPILFDFKAKVVPKKICIMYGENKVSILEEMQKSGMVIPDWMWESARNDPS